MFVLVAALLIAADQLTKWWASTTFPLNGVGQYVGLGFYFTFVKNTGAAFGILQSNTLVLGILSAVVSVIIFFYLLRNARQLPLLQRAALTLILAGAIGNMLDRFRLGYVIDFIHFNIPSFSFPVFNVADSCVVVGAGLLLITSFFGRPSTEPALPPEAPGAENLPEEVLEKKLPEADFFATPDLERTGAQRPARAQAWDDPPVEADYRPTSTPES